MESEIRTKQVENGELQRWQVVHPDSWESLNFFRPDYDPASFERVCNLYERFIVPRCPWIFGQLLLFRLPEDRKTELPFDTGRYGRTAEPLTAAAAVLRRGVKILFGRPVFLSRGAKELWRELSEKGCVRIVRGALPCTTVLPVGNSFGFMSRCRQEAALKVNSSFFIMDRFDVPTVYDVIGTPIGLSVKEGRVLNPPLFDREALTVYRDGTIRVTRPRLEEYALQIKGERFVPGENAKLFSRPACRVTPRFRGTELVIIGTRVAAVHRGGRTFVPASGFVLRCVTGDCAVQPGDTVDYCCPENVKFSIQVGNSVVRDGEGTTGFLSPFYNIRKLWSTAFPPSLYPLDYNGARAPRIALGADREGKPLLVWVEGAGKFGHRPGEEGCGASLSELSSLCRESGMVQGVNLDGGGSAQILLNNRRALRVSDRDGSDFSECERAVPIGLIIE